MIDVNVKGLLYVSRHILKYMVRRNAGHVVNIGSIASHLVYPGGSVYCASKHAEKAISEGMKMDVHGTKIRVTSIDPGMVNTNFSLTRFAGDKEKADAVYKGMTPKLPRDRRRDILLCHPQTTHQYC